MDGDGVIDIAVGARLDDEGGSNDGAIYIMFMNTDGTAREMTKLGDHTETYFNVNDGDQLRGLDGIGDLDGDGIPDLAVGETFSDVADTNEGALWILFLKSDGTVKNSVNLYDATIPDTGWGASYYLGSSLASIGDVDGDGVNDIAVGAYGDDNGATDAGSVTIIFMNRDGSAKGSQAIRDADLAGALDSSDVF